LTGQDVDRQNTVELVNAKAIVDIERIFADGFLRVIFKVFTN
jgi:hypothetical protein